MPLRDNAIVRVDDAMSRYDAPETDFLRVEGLINAASDRIERFCNSLFRARRLRLLLDGTGTPLLDLGGPIITAHSVTFDGTLLVEGRDKDYMVRKPQGQLYRPAGWGTLVALIDVDATLGQDPIPGPVVEGCFVLVGEQYRFKGGDLQSESIQGYSYTRFAPSIAEPDADMPKEVRDMLLPYRRWAF